MSNKRVTVEKQTDDWVTLIDPVGHPFCFVNW